MKTSRNVLFVSGALFGLLLSLALTASDGAIAQTSEPLRVMLEGIGRIVGDVRITNAADSPIPTRVEGPLEITSSPGTPVAMKSGLRVVDTFSKEVTINLGPTQFSGTASFEVPGAKLLAIEGFSGFAQTAHPWQYPIVRFRTKTNGEFAMHVVFANQAGDGWVLSPPGWGGNQAYADPDSTVELFFGRSLPSPGSNGGAASMTLTFVGHFIDQ